MPKVIGYGRVSTGDGQDPATQKATLERAGAAVVFVEIKNGSKLDGRDELETALRLLDRGDTLLAVHPDRLARDTADLLTIARRVVERGAVLRILEPAINFDGTDIMAEMMLTLFGLVGKVEKHFIKSRQRRGIEAAKEKGIYKGRPKTIDMDAVYKMYREHGGAETARRLGIARASVYRVLDERERRKLPPVERSGTVEERT